MSGFVPPVFDARVAAELPRARRKHPKPINSRLEGYGVIKEEMHEYLHACIDNATDAACLEELVQIGAMAQRTAEDIGLCEQPPVSPDCGAPCRREQLALMAVVQELVKAGIKGAHVDTAAAIVSRLTRQAEGAEGLAEAAVAWRMHMYGVSRPGAGMATPVIALYEAVVKFEQKEAALAAARPEAESVGLCHKCPDATKEPCPPDEPGNYEATADGKTFRITGCKRGEGYGPDNCPIVAESPEAESKEVDHGH